MKDFSFIRKLIIEQKIIFAILGLMFINFIVLDYFIFTNKLPSSKSTTQSTSSAEPCSESCIEQINQAVGNLKTSLGNNSTPPPQVIQQNSTPSNSNGNVDVYIPLGTGVSSSTSWSFVPGTQAYINSAQYSSATSITFEASVAVYNANEDVYLQLYDVTAGHAVWSSGLLSHSGSTGNLMISSPIQLDPGNNLYQVQMQTQLGAPANVTQSQVHINL